MLSQVFSKEKTQKIIDVMPPELIVWKAVGCIDECFVASIFCDASTDYYKSGLCNNIPGKWSYSGYPIGYHSFIKKGQADIYRDGWFPLKVRGTVRVVSARISKIDIYAIGYDQNDCGLTIVTTQIFMPTYPNTDITKELEPAPLMEDCQEAMELMEV